ncbi:retropepsin-like aspartic protease family protein [sulfur-oxidizing endosymbiont of Gigantopelta aegis]|uniref:retropepsin-like aspartic protease family protein n=1 Tax=sulfur-oxidizing endosymbiont of Gigantopelta aegis TaxID=2794934 RepID=UPI0018DC7222|nr:TIGR02281 family clan AA aspartic protease [sulfur-oxidizing endosymbiont of Gigantopelta aegis]
MMVIAMAVGLFLLTQYFQDVLSTQDNPNQNIATTHDGQVKEVSLKRNRAGHYVATGSINGQQAVFLLDTGATYVAIPEHLAARLNLAKGQQIQLSTANGRSIGYRTRIQRLSIGQIHLYNIKAVITPNLEDILLGMSVLKQLEFTQRGKFLTIRQYL